jgi:penicillin amidase
MRQCPDGIDSYRIPGLRETVEVLVDEFGVPHLYANSEDDLFLAQGFNAARERLFQLDLWRRRGLGRLSEVFGPEYVERDRAARLFLYRGDMHAEWLAYGPNTERVVTSFVAGVNAFIALCEASPELLPVEFGELGYAPARWEPADVAIIRSHGLFYNVEQEVARALTLRDYGARVEDLRRVREPQHDLVIPDGLDLSSIPDDVLRVYRLATSQPVLGASAGGPAAARTDPEGSNNWVVGASRSSTGRPLLANDPHRTISMPSLRYIAHLSAPGLDVIGAGEPALPGISIGHNGHIAFGLTIFAIDQEDLYVYQTNPQRPEEYRYRDRWEPMRILRETVEVAGAAPVEVELRFTRHGPVIYQDPSRGTAFAVRAAWLEPGMAPYLGSMDYMRAASCDQFTDAMNRWGAPGENQVYAAPDGTIGWRPAGLVPIRPNWDGTLPVPGDGGYEWAGFYDVEQLPSERNPRRDWVATANEMNLPPDYPNTSRTVTFDWYHRYRYDRIAEVLDDATGFTVQDCVRLQADTVNVAARQVLRALDVFTHPDPDVGRALDLLRAWDADETMGSPAAALYEVWFRQHLRPALLSHSLEGLVPPSARAQALERLLPDEVLASDVRTDLALLRDLVDGGTDRRAALHDLLGTSLTAAVARLRTLLGDEVADWRWGSLHHAAPTHPLFGLLDPSTFGWTRLAKLPRAGSGDTVCSTSYDAEFRQTSGASFRVVVDVGDWDRSVAINSPGQSGRPGDGHYDDLYQRWADDDCFPLYYSRSAIEEHTTARYQLVPCDE